eukprot:4624456-Amphidinium_carterae.2
MKSSARVTTLQCHHSHDAFTSSCVFGFTSQDGDESLRGTKLNAALQRSSTSGKYSASSSAHMSDGDSDRLCEELVKIRAIIQASNSESSQ